MDPRGDPGGRAGVALMSSIPVRSPARSPLVFHDAGKITPEDLRPGLIEVVVGRPGGLRRRQAAGEGLPDDPRDPPHPGPQVRRGLTGEQAAAFAELRALARPFRFRVVADADGFPGLAQLRRSATPKRRFRGGGWSESPVFSWVGRACGPK